MLYEFRVVCILPLTITHFLVALLEEEKQRIDQITAGWDDPTSINWGQEDKDEVVEIHAADSREPAPLIYKCTALYSYTVLQKFLVVENEIQEF